MLGVFWRSLSSANTARHEELGPRNERGRKGTTTCSRLSLNLPTVVWIDECAANASRYTVEVTNERGWGPRVGDGEKL